MRPRTDDPDDYWGEIVYVCTRGPKPFGGGAQVDVTVTAKEAGFVIPTALNSAEWEACARPATMTRHGPAPGRSWTTLGRAREAGTPVRRNLNESRVAFTVLAVPNHGRGRNARAVRVVLDVGPGGAGEPMIKIDSHCGLSNRGRHDAEYPGQAKLLTAYAEGFAARPRRLGRPHRCEPKT